FVASLRLVDAEKNISELWLTDGSRQIHNLRYDGTNLEYVDSRSLDLEVKIGEEVHKIVSVLKMEFFSGGKHGYIKIRTNKGATALLPFYLQMKEIEVPVEEEPAGQLDLFEPETEIYLVEELVVLNEATPIPDDHLRSSTFKEEGMIFVSYPDRVLSYRL